MRSAGAWSVVLACAALVASCDGDRAPQSAASEPRFRYDLLDNGDFTEANADVVDAHGLRRIPWWRSSRGMQHVVEHDGRPVVELKGDDRIAQPLSFYAPLLSTLELSWHAGEGLAYEIVDARGQVTPATAWVQRITPERTVVVPAGNAAASAVPRLELRFSCANSGGAAAASTTVADVKALVDLPCPSEAALRAELVAEIDAIFTTWLTRGSDDVGPRKTAFLAKGFDAITGKQLHVSPATGFSSFYQALLDASLVEDKPAWKAAFAAFFADFVELQLHPKTGLPRSWNPETDTAIDDAPTEIALVFGFLIDVAERGPKELRERARKAALAIGETVLAKGLLPDGNCAASYWPATGEPNLSVNQLRRLDVPLQLMRLSKLVGEERFALAAREPLVTLEFTNYWHGTWDTIDPGFDDNFGHYGARAVRALLAVPNEPYYRRFALEGWKRYEPLWRDALRFGGNVAADQVRCWKLAVDIARVEPSLKPVIGPLLRTAARSHFKGEQYGNGAWGDVTVFDYGPKDIPVGDFPGTPQNLLTGLAAIYVDELGLRTDEIRAMYTAVLRSTVTQYRRPYGYLLTRETAGSNSALGSMRVLPALVEMLTALARQK